MSRDRSPLHVVSWNVDGLAPHLGDAPRGSLEEIARAFGSPDVLCLQELRLRPADAELLRLAEGALDGYAFVHSLADDPRNASFRGGRTYGVGTYVRGALRAAFVPPNAWDREGRLAAIEIGDMKLAVANVYAVNGTSKPYWDCERGCLEGDRHGWKRRFHSHVAALVRELSARGLDVLLVGDWNVSQTRLDTTPRLRTEEPHALSRAHFADAIVRDLDVVDVFRALHPEARAYTWFSRRAPSAKLDAARVDFALLSRARMGSVLDATIDEARAGSFGSDHAPIHVTLARE